MARSKGIIKFRGTVDGRVFYELNGKEVNREKFGPSREVMDTNPNYKVPKNNALEFGGASKASKAIRDGVREVLPLITDKSINNRLTQHIKLAIAAQPKEDNPRPVHFASKEERLSTFEFESKTRYPLSPVFNFVRAGNQVFIRWNCDRIYAKGVVPRKSNATHFRLFFVAITLSDLLFDEGESTYLPFNPGWPGSSKVEFSNYLPINENEMNVTGELTVDTTNATHAGDAIMICSGMAFYQAYGSSFDLFYTGNCIKVSRVVEVATIENK